MVEARALPLLMPDKMKEIDHPFQTQKNEALQRQATALVPKDKFLGGKMQLHDRLRLLVVLDSVGEYEGMGRLYHSLGLPHLHPVLGLWVHNKDKEDDRKAEHRKPPAVKRKRAEGKIKKMKEGMRLSKRAKKSGCTHESGIANKQAS